jgi:hypothetical protein
MQIRFVIIQIDILIVNWIPHKFAFSSVNKKTLTDAKTAKYRCIHVLYTTYMCIFTTCNYMYQLYLYFLLDHYSYLFLYLYITVTFSYIIMRTFFLLFRLVHVSAL